MLIGIDASRLQSAEPTGVENYSYHIIPQIIAHAREQKKDHIILYTRSKLEDSKYPLITGHPIAFFTEHPKTFVAERIIPHRRLWTQIGLARELYRHPVDVLFVPSHVLPRFLPKKIRAVCTIHDLAFLQVEKVYRYLTSNYLAYTTRYQVKRSANIIVPSHATEQDLVSMFNCDQSKIVVIPHGIPEKRRMPAETLIEHTLKKFLLDNDVPYMLYIGRIEEKKNISRMIQAFSMFAVDHKDWRLVIAGSRGVGASRILKDLLDTPLREKIILTGYLNPEQKTVLLSHAKALLLLSLYEGFGFPILEAFQHGIPVMASQVSSLPEVCGEAAYLVDPFDIKAIAQGMESIIFHAEFRKALLEKGQEQLSQFSWKKAGKKTWEILNT